MRREVPALAVGAAVRAQACSSICGAGGDGILRLRACGVAILGRACLVTQGGLALLAGMLAPALLFAKDVAEVEVAEVSLKSRPLPLSRRALVACHGFVPVFLYL